MSEFTPANKIEPDPVFSETIADRNALLKELDEHNDSREAVYIPAKAPNGTESPTKTYIHAPSPREVIPDYPEYHGSGVVMSEIKTDIAVYIRVSSEQQHTANQFPAIENFLRNKFPSHGTHSAGLRAFDVYYDHESGRHTSRESWGKLFNAGQRGKYEHIITWAVDRLSRDCGQFCTMLNILTNTHGVHLHFVKNHISTDSPMGMFMAKFFALFGEFEAVMLDERRVAGQNRARAAGKHMGRLPDVEHDPEIFEMVYTNPEISQRAVAKHFNKSRPWAKAAIKRAKEDMVAKTPPKTE